jgi:hypothetical protein
MPDMDTKILKIFHEMINKIMYGTELHGIYGAWDIPSDHAV